MCSVCLNNLLEFLRNRLSFVTFCSHLGFSLDDAEVPVSLQRRPCYALKEKENKRWGMKCRLGLSLGWSANSGKSELKLFFLFEKRHSHILFRETNTFQLQIISLLIPVSLLFMHYYQRLFFLVINPYVFLFSGKRQHVCRRSLVQQQLLRRRRRPSI